MIPLYLYLLTTSAALIITIQSAPASYQYVNFIRSTSNSRGSSNTKSNSRSARSFDLSFNSPSTNPFELWDEDFFYPLTNSVTLGRTEHVTPDFSNGLAYPDPFLLTGLQAKRAVAILYRKELFFDDIPHIRAIEYNQQQRKINGLDGNRLGSLRPHLPFYRFKKQSFGFF